MSFKVTMVLVVIALAIIFLVYLTVIKQTNSKYWSDTPSVSDNGSVLRHLNMENNSRL